MVANQTEIGYVDPMPRRQRSMFRLAMLPILALAGCDGGDQIDGSARSRTADNLRDQLLVVSPQPPQILVSQARELERAARFGATARIDALRERRGVRRVRADSLAWLTGSAEGRMFLAAETPRAIARGDPARSCPATGLASGAPEGTSASREAVVRRALSQCLSALGKARSRCSCRLIAFDDILTVPREEMAYATGIAARLALPGAPPAVLVAEDEPEGVTLLRDLQGPVARLTRGTDDAVTLSFLDEGLVLSGTRRALGYRRGRLAEDIRFDGGGRLSIGLSPAEWSDSQD